jgi:hypothetical protein
MSYSYARAEAVSYTDLDIDINSISCKSLGEIMSFYHPMTWPNHAILALIILQPFTSSPEVSLSEKFSSRKQNSTQLPYSRFFFGGDIILAYFGDF